MFSPSVTTYHHSRVLHCSKQCYSSSTPRPFSSYTVFALTSSTDEKWVPFSSLFTFGYRKKSLGAKSANMDDVQILECAYREETSWPKRCCELGHCPDAASRHFSSRYSAASSSRFVELSLSVNTHHVCNHSHTQPSIFANNYTGFLNVLVSFRSQRVTWMLIIFHFLPTLTKSFVPLKHTWMWH